MPWWEGCVRLRGRQIFLLIADNPASFDGRYFGGHARVRCGRESAIAVGAVTPRSPVAAPAMAAMMAALLAAPAHANDRAEQVVDYRTYHAAGQAGYGAGYRAETDDDAVSRWQPYIDEASSRFGVPVRWITRVMRAESAGRTTRGGRPIRSPAGAIGLMQLMPPTWAEMRRRLGLGSDPDEPRANILAGTLYLRLMYDRFGYPGLFGAYNAGPVRYAAYLDGRQRLPGETRAYLAQVAGRDEGGDARHIDSHIAGTTAVIANAGARPPSSPRPPLVCGPRRWAR